MRRVSTVPAEVLPMHGHSASLVNGNMHVIGGLVQGAGFNLDVLRYDVVTGKWDKTTKKERTTEEASRYQHSAETFRDTIFVYGGFARQGRLHGDTWQLDTSKLKWQLVTTRGVAPGMRAGHASGIYNNQIYYFGGWSSTGLMNDLYQFNPETSFFTLLSGPSPPYAPLLNLPSHRKDSAICFHDDSLYILGGQGIGTPGPDNWGDVVKTWLVSDKVWVDRPCVLPVKQLQGYCLAQDGDEAIVVGGGVSGFRVCFEGMHGKEIGVVPNVKQRLKAVGMSCCLVGKTGIAVCYGGRTACDGTIHSDVVKLDTRFSEECQDTTAVPVTPARKRQKQSPTSESKTEPLFKEDSRPPSSMEAFHAYNEELDDLYLSRSPLNDHELYHRAVALHTARSPRSVYVQVLSDARNTPTPLPPKKPKRTSCKKYRRQVLSAQVCDPIFRKLVDRPVVSPCVPRVAQQGCRRPIGTLSQEAKIVGEQVSYRVQQTWKRAPRPEHY
eukprot:TRINITY_DN37873_c0_g1_i1.p1 TRINITY_DN37873_c0_g1~~TRINITY_DN37873_c0_g1_i1.p1  ORF type:complete len:496 (+),score=55.63 TRINITY_DN37873_c0_g1_i1:79-1566(+)